MNRRPLDQYKITIHQYWLLGFGWKVKFSGYYSHVNSGWALTYQGAQHKAWEAVWEDKSLREDDGESEWPKVFNGTELGHATGELHQPPKDYGRTSPCLDELRSPPRPPPDDLRRVG